MLRNQEGAWASWSSCWRPAACVAVAGDGGATWRGGEKPAGVGQAAGGRAIGLGGAGRAARGTWQRGRSLARGGGRCSRETEREGREEDDGDFFAIFQKFKAFTIKLDFLSNHSPNKNMPENKSVEFI
jgi:hypothetical protein